ncbi:MAG TPA: hypothetical protein VFY45_00340 [Baekduia sp.]|nr:hypothetical protein [Baekduia sp.]
MIGVFGARTGQEELDAPAPSVRDGWMGMGARVAAFEEGEGVGNLDLVLIAQQPCVAGGGPGHVVDTNTATGGASA